MNQSSPQERNVTLPRSFKTNSPDWEKIALLEFRHTVIMSLGDWSHEAKAHGKFRCSGINAAFFQAISSCSTKLNAAMEVETCCLVKAQQINGKYAENI